MSIEARQSPGAPVWAGGPVFSAAAPAASGFHAFLSRVLSYPVALGAALVAATILNAAGRFADPDLWWHLKVGEVIWRNRAIPSSDLFSFTAQGHPWTAHEWLSELTMFGAYSLGGYTALMIWLSVLASAIFLLVYLTCWLHTDNALVAFRSGMVAWCFASVGLAVRPLILGHVFLAAEILILELARTRRHRWVWLLPPLFAVWVNCHGTYMFGLAVLVVYYASARFTRSYGLVISELWSKDARRALGWSMALSAVALCVNPVGVRLWLYPLDTLFHQQTGMSTVQEWLPPNLREGRTLAMIAAAAGVFLLCMFRKSAVSVRELLLLLLASGLALRHGRMMFLFGIVVGPMLCRFGWARERKRANPLANTALISFCAVAVWFVFPTRAELENQVLAVSPVRAVEYIRQAKITGPMLNDYDFGGYLIWSLPELKVFIDGRADVFDWTGVMSQYMRWANLQDDPRRLLDKYGIRFCLLSRGSPVARVFPYLPGWKKVYADDVAVVFIRS